MSTLLATVWGVVKGDRSLFSLDWYEPFALSCFWIKIIWVLWRSAHKYDNQPGGLRYGYKTTKQVYRKVRFCVSTSPLSSYSSSSDADQVHHLQPRVRWQLELTIADFSCHVINSFRLISLWAIAQTTTSDDHECNREAPHHTLWVSLQCCSCRSTAAATSYEWTTSSDKK